MKVDNAATCSAPGPFAGEALTFLNEAVPQPLTNLEVSVDSQNGDTSSTMDCNGTTGSTGADGDGTLTLNDLPPGTYTCSIVISAT